MHKAIVSVEEFHREFGLSIHYTPRIPDEWTQTRRYNLIQEEVVKELLPAISNNDLVGIADGSADALYVIIGTCLEYGIPLGPVFNEVHRSNMSKRWPTAPHVRKREDGKVLKPPSYSPPDIEGVLRNFR